MARLNSDSWRARACIDTRTWTLDLPVWITLASTSTTSAPNGPVVMDVADVRGDALAGGPGRGAGVACPVDPFEDPAGLHVLAGVVHVLGRGEEA